MARSFKDRFLTPKVAQAIMSPLGIVLFGVGTAGAVLIGAPLALAAGVGAAVWGGRVLAAVPRNTPRYEVASGKLGQPWRGYVEEARASKGRFDSVVQSMTPGPLRERLGELAARLDDGIEESGRIATRGDALARALLRLDTPQAREQLARMQINTKHGASPETMATMRSLEAQVATADRLTGAARQADERLRLLDARFDELVARAVEVSLGTGDTDVLGNDVDGLVTELEALRIALDETNAASQLATG